jgi:LysM repeat protein
MNNKLLPFFVAFMPLVLVAGFCTRSIPNVLTKKSTVTPPLDARVATQVAEVQSTLTAQATRAIKSTTTPIVTIQLTASTVPATNPTLTPPPGAVHPPAYPLPRTYRLKKGEFPWCIARRFNVDPREMMSLNGFWFWQFYYPGQIIQIPQTGNPFPWRRALHTYPDTYIVRRSDTINSIACYYGDIDPLTIAAANGLNQPYRLTWGQILNIPALGQRVPAILSPTVTTHLVLTPVPTVYNPPIPTPTVIKLISPSPTPIKPSPTTPIVFTPTPIMPPSTPMAIGSPAPDRKDTFYSSVKSAPLNPGEVNNGETPNGQVNPERFINFIGGDTSGGLACLTGDEVSIPQNNELNQSAWVLSCGWQPNESVQTTMRFPNGDIVLSDTFIASGEPKAGIKIKLESLITDPSGEFQLTLIGQTSKWIRNYGITFKIPVGPRIQIDVRNEMLFLYNFASNEMVKVFVYKVGEGNTENPTPLGSKNFQVDAMGRLGIKIENFANNQSTYEYWVVGATSGNALSNYR